MGLAMELEVFWEFMRDLSQFQKRIDKDELKEGMILSNEPGFYRNNKYGIRIENLILVIKSKFKVFLSLKLSLLSL